MEKKLLDLTELSVLCGSVSMMLSSGASPADALSLFALDSDSTGARTASYMAGLMSTGAGFYEAAEKSGAFPEYALGVLKTAEYSGRTEEALGRLADFYERRGELVQRLRAVISYPAALLLMMCGVLAVLVFAVLPMFEKVYRSLTGSLSASGYAYVAWAGIIGRVSLAAAVFAAAVLLVLSFRVCSPEGREKLFRALEKPRFTKNAVGLMALSGFADTLSVLLSSGADPDETMERAAELTENAELKAALERALADMREGAGLAESLFAHKVFPPIYGRLLVAGSESGRLSDALEKLSVSVGRDAEEKLSGLVDAVEPVLVAFLTAAVGLTLLSVMLPLLGILGAV